MQYLSVRNWQKWQSYRSDRGQPPWIKVHRALLRDWEWMSLSDAQRGQLVAIWLLAADRDGVIPASPEAVQRMTHMTSPPDLQLFTELGFLQQQLDSVTPDGRQGGDNVTAQTRLEEGQSSTEAEEETEKGARRQADAYPPGLNLEAWQDYEAHRRKIRAKKLKPDSVIRQQRWLIRQGGPDVQRLVIDYTIRNGYTGLFELKPGNGNGGAKSAATRFKENLQNAIVDD